ncbi:MAG TPA: peptide-methionine (S)-S-oxide reductase MsrA [Leptospiraceae bacterium]|nr:peptide-methionine (S)-S-oxide reductase MsrA [Leptospiraceae bacterium]HNI27962.1 peptide-methionine (S)-S-oxide reductase MsrA [Leptospiraceae bacterium]HNI96589.1 peptide-methionine (S)-S-oxide reductase MsrA [Leptospiraceae bacterium]
MKTEKIILGGGCFWCLEAVYLQAEGIISAVSGYSGGHRENPTYREVCEETTGHAEVVLLEFEPEKISLESILEIFWLIHDPTSLNRQGADEGTQYRSAVYYMEDFQKETVMNSVQNQEKVIGKKIVTEIRKADKFYPAEDYHKNYYNLNPETSYCRYVIRPKLEKYIQFRKKAK